MGQQNRMSRSQHDTQISPAWVSIHEGRGVTVKFLEGLANLSCSPVNVTRVARVVIVNAVIVIVTLKVPRAALPRLGLFSGVPLLFRLRMEESNQSWTIALSISPNRACLEISAKSGEVCLAAMRDAVGSQQLKPWSPD